MALCWKLVGSTCSSRFFCGPRGGPVYTAIPWPPRRRRALLRAMARAAHVTGRTTMALLCLAALPATLAMREAVLSRRSALLGAVLAAAPVPRYSALRAEGPLGQTEGLQTEGLQASRAKCRTLAIGEMLGETREACEARVADTPQQSMLSDGAKTSPLIEQLKQRTAANKDYNSLYVKTVTAGANSGVYDAERNLRLVPMWKTRPVWPARAAQGVDWPRLAGAWRSLRLDPALREASEGPAGRGLSHLVFHIGSCAWMGCPSCSLQMTSRS